MAEAASKDIPEAVPAENLLKQMNAAATAIDTPSSVGVSRVGPPTLLVCGLLACLKLIKRKHHYS